MGWQISLLTKLFLKKLGMAFMGPGSWRSGFRPGVADLGLPDPGPVFRSRFVVMLSNTSHTGRQSAWNQLAWWMLPLFTQGTVIVPPCPLSAWSTSHHPIRMASENDVGSAFKAESSVASARRHAPSTCHAFGRRLGRLSSRSFALLASAASSESPSGDLI